MSRNREAIEARKKKQKEKRKKNRQGKNNIKKTQNRTHKELFWFFVPNAVFYFVLVCCFFLSRLRFFCPDGRLLIFVPYAFYFCPASVLESDREPLWIC